MALAVAANGCRGPDTRSAAEVDPATLRAALAASAPPLVIDVREPSEFSGGHIAGALNIPVGLIASRAAELPRDRELVLVCHSGRRSARALELLQERGYGSVTHLSDGMRSWSGPTER